MSDEEESMSEGFSASEDEWKPTKDTRGGESSDDDDSDFEESPVSAIASAASGAGPGRKKTAEPKARSATKQTGVKKRAGLSLRAKLYNKYRPLPKTISPPSSGGKNSPSASTSRMNSKNAKTPNESSGRHLNDDDDGGSTSDGSIGNYLVNPDDLDLQSSFFNVEQKATVDRASVSPAMVFDCNAGLGNLSDSESEEGENNDSGNFHKEESKAFDFTDLLENAKSLERVKESIANRSAADKAIKTSGTPSKSMESKIDSLDVYSVLALGEKQHRSHNDGEDEDDEEDDEEAKAAGLVKTPSRLSKTKSTRVKRHTKTRPASTVVAGGDTDDSEFEEVADTSESANTTATTTDTSHVGNLEIYVELPSNRREKKTKTQQEIENSLKRKINREMKDRFLLMHKASLLCLFGRSYHYNRLLNDIILMQSALKLLPSKNAYPPEKGTELKYYQSLVTWFKSALKLTSQNLYPEEKATKSMEHVRKRLIKEMEKKQVESKQDMIFIFIILLRGMGLQCRLVVNMQPLPLKPAQSDLLSIKLKQDAEPEKDTKKEIKTEEEKGSHNKSQTSAKPEKEAQNVKGEAKASSKDKKDESLKAKIAKAESSSTNKEKSHEKEDNKKESLKAKIAKAESSATKVVKDDSPKAKLAKAKSSSSPKEEKSQEKADSLKAKLAKAKSSTSRKEEASQQSDDVKAKIDKAKSSTSKEEKSQEPMAKHTKTEKHSAKTVSPDKASHTTEETHKSKRGLNTKSENVMEEEEAMEAVALAGTRESRKRRPNTKTKHESLDSLSPKKEKLPSTSLGHENNQDNKDIKKRNELDGSQKENTTEGIAKPTLARLKRGKAAKETETQSKKPHISKAKASNVPKVVIKDSEENFKTDASSNDPQSTSTRARVTRSRSKSPQIHISAAFLQSKLHPQPLPSILPKSTNVKARAKSPINKAKISAEFLKNSSKEVAANKRILRSRQRTNEADVEPQSNAEANTNSMQLQVPQMDGAEDEESVASKKKTTKGKGGSRKQKGAADTDDDFEPSPNKRPKLAPTVSKKDRRVVSPDCMESSPEKSKRKATAGDMWVEVWSDVEEEWLCVDLFKGKIHCVEAIRKSASTNMAYVFAFQNDLSLKDVTARYNPNWTQVVRKSRVEKPWLDTALQKYVGHRTMRDIKEDQELRRIHEEKPMPTAISDYKNHPFYALERHLLKFQAIYPPNAPALGYVRGQAVYSRDCIHTLHSREIWLKSARTVKLGEKPYKIVKARPKWDRMTQTVIKDQPLEIYGYWQTEDYDPPTAENGMVPRNAYGNVELFQPSMLPKKCVHLRLPGLNRICKKLGIDCANAVVGFDFHQGACHPTYDGFIVCEEFGDQVTAAWYQDQEDQDRKEQEKYEARVYGNWKKLIRGLLIRERIKLKYGL